MWPIWQSKIHDRQMFMDGERHAGTSVFPLFDDAGMTHLLMVTTGDSPDIGLLDYRPGLLQRLVFRPPRLARCDLALRPTKETLEGLDGLWHVDPWWALTDPRYAGHPLVPKLKATNISGYDHRWRDAGFDRHLRRIRVVQLGTGAEATHKWFKPPLLGGAKVARARATAHQRSSATSHANWRLRPFWQRAD